MDIISTHRSNGLFISINQGGSWNTKHIDDTYGWEVLIADFDEDGNFDIFDGTDWDYIKIFYGCGADSVVQGPAPALEYLNGHARGFNAIDINNDSRLDLIGTASEWNGSGTNRSFLRAYLNIDTLPSDTIEWTASIGPEDSLAYNPNWLESSYNSAADLDGNGYIDQVAYYNSGELVIFWGFTLGDSFYWEPDTLASLSGVRAASIYDIDEDGELDLLVGGMDSFDGFKIYYGDGSGNFSKDSISLDHGVTSFHGHALKFGDINGDGFNDIVVGRYDFGDDGFEVLFKKLTDVSAKSIIIPGSFVEPATSFYPEVVYENLGTDTADFQALVSIDSAGNNLYLEGNMVNLGSGSSDTVSFPEFIVAGSHGVVYEVSAFTIMAEDSNPSNDTVSIKTSVFKVNDELISNWAVSPPIIDGVIDTAAGEWDSSFIYDISDVAGKVDGIPDLPGECYLYLLNNDSTLYFGIDFISDATLDTAVGGGPSDGISMFIDENNDDVWDLDSTEGFYQLGWNGHSDTLVYTSQPDSISEQWGNPSGISFGRTLVDNQQYEISIPMGADSIFKHYLNNTSLPDTLGVLIASMNVGDTNFIGGVWPTEVDATFGENPPPSEFGNLILSANPSGVEEENNLPEVYSMKVINPLSSSGDLKISFAVPLKTNSIELYIFDITGRVINKMVKSNVSPGFYSVKFKNNLIAGVYFVQFKAGGFSNVKKAIILR
jgi:hypothetical protein